MPLQPCRRSVHAIALFVMFGMGCGSVLTPSEPKPSRETQAILRVLQQMQSQQRVALQNHLPHNTPLPEFFAELVRGASSVDFTDCPGDFVEHMRNVNRGNRESLQLAHTHRDRLPNYKVWATLRELDPAATKDPVEKAVAELGLQARLATPTAREIMNRHGIRWDDSAKQWYWDGKEKPVAPQQQVKTK